MPYPRPGEGGQLPTGGPYVVEDGAYDETSSSGITVNNYNSVQYTGAPFETQAPYAINPQVGLTLITDPLPDGEYTVNVNFCYGTSSTQEAFVGNLWVDGVTSSLEPFSAEPKDTLNTPYVGVEGQLIIDDGLNIPHTIEIRFGRRSLFGNRRAQLYYANLRIQSEV
ncbi:hypothetical protein NVP1210O_33 [Vibrio phage 1.210.O._10N.222.52.C2]|nr:hypothetical protein NVP1210O_33 [Vibrio phage 1.210.O._10N.222.52.C2]